MDVTNSHDPSRGFNYGSTAEHGQQFPVREEDETSAVDRNKSPNKGRLTPMLSSLPLSTQQKMVNDDKKKPPKKGRLTPMRSPIPVSIPVALAEPLLTPVVEGREVEILKSIVYGGLAEAIASLGVISSAAGSGASTFAILSFIITGLLPPVVYYFSFRETHNKDYKVASVFGASLICITLLALAKAHVRNPRSSYLKSVLYYATTSVAVSGITYVVGNVVNQLIEKYGWSDGSETQAGEMMLSLMGRKAGGFGYSSSY
ncbi:membrane protein of ER body-like protein [Raphanus sativus]|uniref:Membrane protein of ER body-like protein n=1 Tax=Raphanus sativus TaxID=3726 RepID=A0A9W3CLL8_RAPSA|nr:membrane protein of ER body-like protein [Raphanus sativus]